MFRRGDLDPVGRPACGDLEDPEQVVVAVAGEEDARGVEVDVDVTHDRPVVGVVEGGEGRFAPDVGDDGNFVVDPGPGQVHVVVGVEAEQAEVGAGERLSRVADLAADAEDLVEVEDRVGEQRGAISLDEFLRLALFRLVLLLQRLEDLLPFFGERLDGGTVLGDVVPRLFR